MTTRIKIVRTTVAIYDPAEQDPDYYVDAEAQNVDQCATADLNGLSAAEFGIGDLGGDGTTTYEAMIVEVNDENEIVSERPVNEKNEERDYELFPKTDDESGENTEDEDTDGNVAQ